MRISSGIPGFDALVQGGIPAGAAVVVQGPAGQEKDTFLFQFVVEGLRGGGSALVVLSSTSPAKYIDELREAGVDVDLALAENRLKFVDWFTYKENPVQDVEQDGPVFRASIDLANVGIAISRAIAALPREGERRAAIEVLSTALSVYDLSGGYGFAQATKAKLERSGFTSLFVLEKEMHDDRTASSIHQPFDGVVDIERVREGDTLVRKIAVLSLRGTAAESKYVPLNLGADQVLRVAIPATRDFTGMGTKATPPGEGLTGAEFLSAVEKRLRDNPGDADALFVKAAALARAKDFGGAVATLEELARVDETYPGLWILKTKLHARRGELDKAEESLRRRIELDRRHELDASELAAEIRQPSPAKLPPPPASQSFCPICGFAAGSDDTSCSSCGATFEIRRAPAAILPVRAPKPAPEVVPLTASPSKPEPKVPPKIPPPIPRPEGEGRTPPPREPLVTPSQEPSSSRGSEGLVKEASHKMGKTNGLVNGLRGRTNGLVNGLRGRTNGLVNGTRGRTNGLVNGTRGRTNGLVNGLRGRTNGLTNGVPGKTNGLVNGTRGRTNGLVNGLRGRTNGLVNGTGLTEGLGSNRLAQETRRTKWEIYVIPLVTVALLLVPIFATDTFSGPRGIVVDGEAADWDAGRLAPQGRSPSASPNVDIIRAGTVTQGSSLFFLVEVEGTILAGGGSPATTDRFNIFLDTDGDATTGYVVDSLGADRLIDVSGHGGAVEDASIYEWNKALGPLDWRGWERSGFANAAVAGSRLEIRVDGSLLAPEPTPVASAVHARAFDATVDTSDGVFHSAGGSLVVVQEPVVADVLAGPAAALLLRLDASAFAGDATLSGISVRLMGLANLSTVTSVRLVDGVGSLVDERVPMSAQVDFQFVDRIVRPTSPQRYFVIADVLPSDGSTLGAIVAKPSDVSASVPVSIRRAPSPRDVGYLSVVPTEPRVDGGFLEWTATLSDDLGDTGPSEVDLTAFDARFLGNASYFYAAVDGRLLSGTWVPEGNRGVYVPSSLDQDGDTVPDSVDPYPYDFNNDLIPDADSGGDVDADGILDHGQVGGTDWWLNTTIPGTFPPPYGGTAVHRFIGPWEPPFRTRDDVVRVFVDLDNSTTSGYAITGIGADRLVEISGTEGELRSAAFSTFVGSHPGQWAWIPRSQTDVALSFNRMEFSVPENFGLGDSRFFVEARAALGDLDNVAGTRGGEGGSLQQLPRGAHAPMSVLGRSAGGTSSFAASGNPGPMPLDIGGNQKLYLRDTAHTETACTTNKVASSTQGAGSVKSVTLSSGQDACWYADSTTGTTISAGDWETLLDVDTSVPKSAFKDGGQVDVPTTIGLLDSVSTTFPSANNLIVAAIQLDKTGTGTATVSAGDLEIRRGTSTSDPFIAENQFQISLSANDAAGDGLFAVLVGEDASAPASATYGVFGAASTSDIDAEVKIIVINGLASADTEITDGGSVSFGGTATVLATRTTSFPAASSSLPNIIIAAAQFDRTAGTQSDIIPTNGYELRRGTTHIRGITFRQSITSASNPDGVFALLVGVDTAAGANPTYDVRAWDDNGATVSGEAKILAFRGLAAKDVDSGSVSIGTSRTVLGTVSSTGFATGDDVLIGAIQLEGSGGSRKFAAAANDVRLVGAGSGSSNQFAHTVGNSDTAGSGMWEALLHKVTTTTSNPSYEGAATRPSSGAANGELKLVAIHVNDSAAEYDVHFEIWNLDTNTVAETVGSCLNVMTRGEDVQCLVASVGQKTILATQVVRIRLVHSSSSGKVAFDYDDSDTTGNSRATIPPTYIPEFQDVLVPVLATAFIPIFWRWSPRRNQRRKREATK